MAVKVSVEPRLLKWARERAALAREELARKINLKPERIAEWESSGELTLGHLERLAASTHTPIGYLFLPEPPGEQLPIADFRSPAGGRVDPPSPELLETLYQSQERQLWYRDYLESAGEPRLEFVGSVSLRDPSAQVAGRIRESLGLHQQDRAAIRTWEQALRELLVRIEALGVLVMRNGIVGNNTHRKLDVAEFRGFALSDAFAPLIFVNAADSRSAQMFTLIHELTHIWLGESGVSDASPRSNLPSERFSNRVAAETLVPMQEFMATWRASEDPGLEAGRVARVFKVSPLVVLIRAYEAGVIKDDVFEATYAAEVKRAREATAAAGSGGDFYNTQRSRVGSRFATAVIASALEGRTDYREAYHLLGLRRSRTFDEFARELGFSI